MYPKITRPIKKHKMMRAIPTNSTVFLIQLYCINASPKVLNWGGYESNESVLPSRFILLSNSILSCGSDSQDKTSKSSPKSSQTQKKPNTTPIQSTPEFIEQIQNLAFYKKYGFYLDSKWALSSSYYGPGKHMNYNYDSSSSMGMEVVIKNGSTAETISLSNSNPERALEFVQIFFKDIDNNKLKSYINENLNKSINQIYQTIPFVHEGHEIYAGSIYYGNTLSVKPNSGYSQIPKENELGKKDSYNLINKMVSQEFIKAIKHFIDIFDVCFCIDSKQLKIYLIKIF